MSEARPDLRGLHVRIFADGADLHVVARMARDPLIQGFTTNPTLMRKGNVGDYRGFARSLLAIVPDRPVSFEVFSDDFEEMEGQAREIASWGENVFVKIPITNTLNEFSGPLIHRLSRAGVKVNVTAMMTARQVASVLPSLSGNAESFVSVFAGRVADSGRDPVPLMREVVELVRATPWVKVIWASPREVLNVFQADAVGCHVITATSDILNKLHLVGKDLDEFSLETVRMFREDAVKAGYDIPISKASDA